MIKEDKFESAYALVEYMPKDNTVLLTWKGFCCDEAYQTPTSFALDLLRKYADSNFIVDARHGFLDKKEDVEWGFSYLLPEMAKTDCKYVTFLLEQHPALNEEIHLWTTEFGKYFTVLTANDYKEAIAAMKQALQCRVTYTIKTGKRTAFIDAVKRNEVITRSRQEPANISYDMYLSIEQEDEVHLVEVWPSIDAFNLHLTTAHYQVLKELKETYVLDTEVRKTHLHF